MTVRSVRPVVGLRATLAAWGVPAGRGMSHADAAAVVAISAGVVILLTLTDPKEALCYLLAFPIWIVARDLGVVTGAAVGTLALLLLVVFGVAESVEFGPLGYLAFAAVFFGTVAAGAQAAEPKGAGSAKRRSPLLRMLTTRPQITRRSEALSRRELEILESIATGAKNAEIADRFVISQNTVKSHVSRILKKLPATNRTEAAFRYIELYGPPAPLDRDSATADAAVREPGGIGATTAVNATVSAVGRKDRLVLRLQDGRDLEVPLLEQIRGRVDVGASVIVYFDQRDHAVGWFLPDEELGVDLRHWAP